MELRLVLLLVGLLHQIIEAVPRLATRRDPTFDVIGELRRAQERAAAEDEEAAVSRYGQGARVFYAQTRRHTGAQSHEGG